MIRLKVFPDGRAEFRCPACGRPHGLRVEGPKAWTWNGNAERPTLQPSIDWRRPKGDQPGDHCHSYVRDGFIEYLADCTHSQAGKTLELPPYE
jgi:hypothetical protein